MSLARVEEVLNSVSKVIIIIRVQVIEAEKAERDISTEFNTSKIEEYAKI